MDASSNTSLRKCAACKISKPIDFFYDKTRNCKTCNHRISKEWRRRNPKVAKFYSDRWRYNNPVKAKTGTFVRDIKRRSKKIGMETDIDHKFIYEKLIKGTCEITGIKFILNKSGRANPYSPSIDRINPGIGYIKSNVRMILYALNVFKNEWNDFEIYKIAKVFCEKYEQSNSAHGAWGDPMTGSMNAGPGSSTQRVCSTS
jgi:hypothetical protein